MQSNNLELIVLIVICLLWQCVGKNEREKRKWIMTLWFKQLGTDENNQNANYQGQFKWMNFKINDSETKLIKKSAWVKLVVAKRNN